MSWNINGSSSTILKDINAISDLIIQEEADVVYIAEDFYDCCDSLDALLKTIYPFSTHIICDESHYFYSKYPLGKKEWIGRDIDTKCCIIECSIEVKGIDVRLYGCHLSSNNYTKGPKHNRLNFCTSSILSYLHNVSIASELRAAEIKALLSTTKNKKPTLILGDMNDVIGSPSLDVLKRAHYSNAWANKGAGYGATIYHPIPYRIDHIFYNDGLELKSIKKIESIGLSDHDALVGIFNVIIK